LSKNYPMFIFNIGDYIVHILSWLRSQKSIDTSISINYYPWCSWFFNVSNGKLIWSDLYIWDQLLWNQTQFDVPNWYCIVTMHMNTSLNNSKHSWLLIVFFTKFHVLIPLNTIVECKINIRLFGLFSSSNFFASWGFAIKSSWVIFVIFRQLYTLHLTRPSIEQTKQRLSVILFMKKFFLERSLHCMWMPMTSWKIFSPNRLKDQGYLIYVTSKMHTTYTYQLEG
jgi:hypothetical protein